MAASRIELLGKPRILDEHGASQPVRGRQAWALLARLLLSDRPLDRSQLASELFAESVDPLGSLRWCLAELRKALNESECLVGDPIRLNLPEHCAVDLWLLDSGELPIAAMGTLLAGGDPQASPEFETWLLLERSRIDSIADDRIRRETMEALALGDYNKAIRISEMAVARDNYNESAHILLVKAMALAGRASAALAHVEATERLFERELGIAPSGALRSAARLSVASPPAGIPAEAHVKSLIRSGVAALAAGAPDAGIEALRQAVAQAEKGGDLHLQSEALFELGAGLVHSVRGHDDEGAVLLRQSVEIARSRGYARIAAAGLMELGYVDALAGRRHGARDQLNAALGFAEDRSELAGVHSLIGFNLVDWGRVDEGLEHFAASVDHARAAGNRRREIWSLGLGARGLLMADRVAEAQTWLQDCLDLVDDTHWVAFRPWPMAVLAETMLRQQRSPTEQRGTLQEAFSLSCQLRDPCWEAASCRSMALVHTAESDLPGAAGWLEEAHARCIRESDPYVALRVEILADSAQIHRRLGNGELSESLSREWLSQAARAHMDAHVSRAAAFLAGAAS